MQNILIIGCGYTGLRLGMRLSAMAHRVVGTARSAERINAMQAAGIESLTGGLTDDAMIRQLRALEPVMVTYFVPPQNEGADPLPIMLEAFRDQALEAFIYASATSVYGDHQGAWVDENTPLTPGGLANTARIEAERLVQDAATAHGMPTRVCRISGIYGPGRTMKKPLESGRYTLIEGHESWVGRIHVDDLVTGIIAAWQKGENGRVYNMVDQRPHLASEFANLSADLNGLPRPGWISEADAKERYSPGELRRKFSNKRIRCSRLVDELGVELKYPSFMQGLPAAVAEDQS